jgi:phytoene dehydrogenase-like protein
VALFEAAPAFGGVLRDFEFTPGFRVAPFAGNVGWMPPEVARGVGIKPPALREADPTVIAPVGDGSWLALRRDPAATAANLTRFSPRDAERWPAFAGLIGRLAGFLGLLYTTPAPRIDPERIGELMTLLRLARKLRGLGKKEMIELLRTVPMAVAELLDDWFEGALVKGVVAATAITDLGQGPMSGGTAFNLLHQQVGGYPGAVGGQGIASPSALIAALAEQARAVGVDLRAGSSVVRVLVRDDRAAGVVLASGEEVVCREVVSSADPYRSLLELVDPVHFDPDFIQAVCNIRFRGVASKVLIALDALPSLPEGFTGSISIAPSIVDLERAADAVKYGQLSERPYVEVRFPSLEDPQMAPAGKHVALLHVQYTPYRLRDGGWESARDAVADRAVRVVDDHLPGFADRVTEQMVLTPADLEARFGLREGAVSHGEMMLDQILFMRPVPGWSRYATPLPGLFLCGSGTHPGGGIVGASGWLAAQAVLRARNNRR